VLTSSSGWLRSAGIGPVYEYARSDMNIDKLVSPVGGKLAGLMYLYTYV
jgi:hypothetical protein